VTATQKRLEHALVATEVLPQLVVEEQEMPARSLGRPAASCSNLAEADDPGWASVELQPSGSAEQIIIGSATIDDSADS
jgi:hypothetical protein